MNDRIVQLPDGSYGLIRQGRVAATLHVYEAQIQQSGEEILFPQALATAGLLAFEKALEDEHRAG